MTEIARRALRTLRSAARASGGSGKKSGPQKRSGGRKKTGKKSAGSSRPKRKQSRRVGKSSTKSSTKSKKSSKSAKKSSAKKSSTKKSPIAKSTIDRLKARLEEERETYVRQAEELAAEAEALMADREPGDTQFDEESGEGDTINVERERDLALSASALQAVEDIDAALDRIKKGTYGICERCGNKIPVARLEAVPEAALCIECKAQQERRR